MSTNIIKEEIGFKTAVGFKVYPKITGNLITSEVKTISELSSEIPIKGRINNANFSSLKCALVFIIKKENGDIAELEYWKDTVLKPVDKNGKLENKDFEIFTIDEAKNESKISFEVLRTGIFGKGKIGWKITSSEYPNFPDMEIKPEDSKVSYNLPLDISITDEDNKPINSENLKVGSKINVNFKFVEDSPFNGCTAEFYIWESTEEVYDISESIPQTAIKYSEKIDKGLETISFVLGCKNENSNEPQFYCNYDEKKEMGNDFEFNYAIKISDKQNDVLRNKDICAILKGRFDNILIPELTTFKIDLKEPTKKSKEKITVNCEFKNFDPEFKFNMDINLYSYFKEKDDDQTHIKLLKSINETVFVEGNKINDEFEVGDDFFKEVVFEKDDEVEDYKSDENENPEQSGSVQTKNHKVTNKESIQEIASIYGTTVQAIVDANPALKSHISTSPKGTKWYWENDSVTIPVSNSNNDELSPEVKKDEPEENKEKSSDSQTEENTNNADEESSKEETPKGKNKIFAELSFGSGTVFSQVAEFIAANAGDKDNFKDFPVMKDGVFATKETGTGVCSNLLDVKGKVTDLEYNVNMYEARVKAFMRMIRVGEGTIGEKGYETLFAHKSFIKDYNKDWSDHPRQLIVTPNHKSTAAGAYQILKKVWDDKYGLAKWRKQYNIKDFSPMSQDKVCLIIFKHKRPDIIQLLIDDKFKEALSKAKNEWASLPNSPYDQPKKSEKQALQLYKQFYEEELQGKSDLHLKSGFLKEFGYEK